MSSYTRFDQWRCRGYSHSRSTGLSSGEYGGRVTSVAFGGATTARHAEWYPAPSHTGTAWTPGGRVSDEYCHSLKRNAVPLD